MSFNSLKIKHKGLKPFGIMTMLFFTRYFLIKIKSVNLKNPVTTQVHPNSRRESMFIEEILQFSLNPEGILCKNVIF
jgi:hypothetical protein